jgi:hypothetical protein
VLYGQPFHLHDGSAGGIDGFMRQKHGDGFSRFLKNTSYAPYIYLFQEFEKQGIKIFVVYPRELKTIISRPDSSR